MQHRSGSDAARNQLVAFVASTRPAALLAPEALAAELRAQVTSSLPEYMVPTSIHVLTELPRNTNGKVDRKALEQMAAERSADTPSSRKVVVLPETAEERQLASIWREILGVAEVGTTDNIFELGADSLLIFRIAARAQREHLPVTATMIFQHRSIAALCRALNTQKETAGIAPQRTRVSIPVAARENYRRTKVEVDG